MDVSANTRESTLDLLWHCLTKIEFEDETKFDNFEREFIRKYLPILVERAEDNSLCVRKKVV